MRLAVLAPLRRDHGWRLYATNRAPVAAASAVLVRLQWARGEWVHCLAAAVKLLSRRPWLETVGLGQGLAAVDLWHSTTLESLIRTTIGLVSRAFALWQGGFYRLVLLLGTPEERTAAAVAAAEVFRNSLFLEDFGIVFSNALVQLSGSTICLLSRSSEAEILILIVRVRRGMPCAIKKRCQSNSPRV